MFDNIHPLVVHLPIAFLGFYTILEILHFRILIRQPYWFYIKAILVIVGALGSGLALVSGEMMSDQFNHTALHQIIEMHQSFAVLTAFIFSGIAAAYIIEWLRLADRMSKVLKLGDSIIIKMARWLVNGKLIILLAVLGLITLVITGALGASMVYGPDSDPMVKIVYHLFF